MVLSTVMLVLLIIGGSLLWSCILFFGLLLLFQRVSGWQALARYFRAPGEPPGLRSGRTTIRVGIVRYRMSASIVLSPAGLYLRTPLPFHPPLLIPWQAITGLRSDHIYWLPAFTLSIGAPRIATVTFLENMLPAMRNLLPPNLPYQA